MDDPVLEQHFVGHKGTVTSLSFSPSEKQLLSSSEDHTFMNWNLHSSAGSLRYKAKSLPVNHVCFSPNGSYIASTQGQFVRLWISTIRGKSIEFRAHFSVVRSAQFSPNGNHLLTASDDKSLKIWVTSKRKFLSSLSGNGGHSNWVRFGTYAPDGHLIVSCSDDKTIKLWDPATSRLVHTFNEMRGAPRHVQFHPTNTCIGVAMATGAVKLYDLKMMKLLQYYPCHDGPVNSLSFHSGGNYLITAGNDCTSKIIDLIEGRAILSLEGHKKAVTAVTFSSSGNFFATASADKNVFVWQTNLRENLETGRLIKESITNEMISIPRLETTLSKERHEHKVTEVYCAKDYEDVQVTNEAYSETLHQQPTITEQLSNPNQNGNICETIDDISITQSIKELTSQVAFLSEKLIDMESRLTQMEETIKSGTNTQ